MSFEVNPYGPCIANKVVNNSKMTVQWHVDDLMISHSSNEAISDFLGELKNIYGENLAKSRGKIHDYLGMKFDFSFCDEVIINMT
jgi:hypothetical protein